MNAIKNKPNSNTIKITRKILRKLPAMGRNALKDLHELVSGEKVFGLRAEIEERTREAICEYLGIDE